MKRSAAGESLAGGRRPSALFAITKVASEADGIAAVQLALEAFGRLSIVPAQLPAPV